MLAAFRSAVPQKSPARYTLINLYTTVADLTRTHWRTGAHPAPQSLVEDENDDEDWPKPQVEGHASLESEHADSDDSFPSRHPSQLPFPGKPETRPTPSEYRAHRETMKKKFPEGWAPPRKISREAMDTMRQLHRLDPEAFSTPILAEKFYISKEAVRRILKSKWEPTREEKAKLAERERKAKVRWRVETRAKEREKHEMQQQESGITTGGGNGDRLTLT